MTLDTPILIGHGYDLHRFARGRKLILGGVEIPSEMGLLGHSDADCLIHALSDAILGALGLPDIGHYFPDSSPENKDLDSLIILKKAVTETGNQGFKLGNIDLTLVLEEPKIAPYSKQIKEKLSDCCGLEVERIGIKATTNEGLGAIGRKEGIAAFAVCTLIKD
ncbi:MAG: 2-C-methyl-D-erythritol 2,4-cyclodiphosphate synthase [Opitutae bacterium]|jgi:2-C-methyl-D-erythritol 2,4-cyclodiphosphate synthase|nr:2-C-methyl-D-erythritol 2,4-cyclodiphosphate synthase [Opitutae bacterium]